MRQFKHYVTTRFNAGLYRPEARIHISADEWMRHRIKLFTTFTLPFIMGQSCQNFTWLVLIDQRTPVVYKGILEGIRYPNMKLIYQNSSNPWLQNIEPGDYDLITTRIDNDDAFHRDAVKVIQDNWCAQSTERPEPRVMVFPFGLILDLTTKQMLVMEYWFNNCPTLIENSQTSQTIWQWDHSNIPTEIHKEHITDKPYWLQVIHSQNLKNAIPVGSHTKIIRRDIPAPLELLAYFGIDASNLPNP